MNRSPPPLRATLPGAGLSFALAALVLLAGCANGDFGEVQPVTGARRHPRLGRDKAIASKPALPSIFELTDDERALARSRLSADRAAL